MVYSESGLVVEKSSKTTDTMNRIILVAAANQKPASSCTLEIYYVTKSTAGLAVITESQGPSGALRSFTTKLQQQYAALFHTWL